MTISANTANKRPVISRKKLQLARLQKQQAYANFETAQSTGIDSDKPRYLSLAKTSIGRALDLNPDDGDSLNLLSRIELEAGQLKEAEQAIRAALDIHPRNGGFHYSLGHIALARQQLEQAELAFKKAIKYAPKETRADVSLAYTLAEAGKDVEAFSHYRELAKTQGKDLHIRSRLLLSARYLTADFYDPELEQDLLSYLQWHNMNPNLLASLTSSLLEHKFQLNKEGSAAQFDVMANCPLLLSALRHTLIKSELLEKLIMALRHELLCYATQKGQLPNEYIPLCQAIAHYGLRAEYLLPDTAAEINMTENLKSIIDQALTQVGCTPMDISGALLLLAMYNTWESLENFVKLMSFHNNTWPAISLDLKQCHDEYLALSQFKFDAVSKIPNSAQHNVKAQYECHPYPRWQALDYNNPTNYGLALSLEFPNSNIPNHIFTDELKILIAGCGTGRHALNVAKHFNHVQVMALDISQSSLAYAKYKADELAVDNIEFFLADLTKIESLNTKFNIIECSGVLHHIKQYKKALNNLLKNLKPNGLMKISLYSERARESVIKIRKLVKDNHKPLNDHKIKVIRHALFQSDLIENKDSIIKSDDFYSLSGTVDLLFHEYEKQFTPLSIKKLCSDHQLKWLGFSNLNLNIKNNFMDFHGNNANLEDLNQWEKFEEVYPDTFAQMYQFYCQYQPKLKLEADS